MLIGNFNDVGGREIHLDDLRILQEELLKAIQLQYAGQGAFILQGGTVVGGDTLQSGLSFINGLVLQFDAVTGITSFPKYLVKAADVPQDSFPLEAGDSAPKRTLQKAELVGSAPVSGEFIVVTGSGGRNYNDVLAQQFVRLQGSQTVNGQKNFTSNIISNGVDINAALSTITANSWVTTPRIADNAVTFSKIADNSVNTNHIGNSQVTTAKIADGSVTGSKIANDAIGSNHLAAGSVSTSEIVDASVTAAKLASDALGMFTGNGANTDLSIDFTTITQTGSRTWGNKLFTLSNNTGKMRPLIYFQVQLARDSGGSDFVQLQLQRSPNLSSWTTIATRNYKLDGDSWTSAIIQTVDTGASSGNNWYRLAATVTSGSLCWMSNNYTATLVGVTVF